MTQPEFMTPEEVADRVRVTRRAVYDWLKDGKLKGYRAGSRWRIRPADLDAFLQVGEGKLEESAEENAPAASPGPAPVATPVRKLSQPSRAGKRRR
jgi:excisionase family DNA binding protein